MAHTDPLHSPSWSYQRAERHAERVGIAMANFMRLWRETYGPNSIPGVRDCEDYIGDFLDREIDARVWGVIKQMKDMRDDATDQLEHDTSLRMMVASAKIEEKLKLEHL